MHVVHLPVLAHEEHVRVPVPTSGGHVGANFAMHANEHAAMDHTHVSGASLPDRGGSEAHLAEHGDDDLTCMTTAATIPTRAATLDALTLPAEIPAVSADGACKPTGAVAHSAGPARRHLVLSVILR